MPDEDERALVRRALDFQARAKEYPLISIPAYAEWSKRKLEEDESLFALIAHLDSVSMVLRPEEVAGVSESDFEELLEELKEDVRKVDPEAKWPAPGPDET
jgi:hypothetical protein